MTCIVLAAGYATRLYPLTKDFPKPLLPIKGKTVLDWLVDDVVETCGLSRLVVVSNHAYASHFEAWSASKGLSIPVDVLDDGTTSNETRLGAVKDIHFAIESLGLDDDLLVIAGDNVLEFSLGLFADYFKACGTSCIMRYRFERKEGRCSFGVCLCDEDGLVLDMEEKPLAPKSDWAVPPFYIYRKADIGLVSAAIDSGCNVDAPGSFVQWVCSRTRVHAFEMPGRRFDIGTIESYEKVNRDYQGIVISG